MKYWEFLIQKEGDQTWLPLETQQVEILEGRYRVVAHTDRVNTPLDIRVSQLITSEMPPRKRVRKRTGKTNETGLVVVMPYVHLKPGQWSLECSSQNLMDDLMGDGWQYGVQLEVFAQTEEDWSSEWPTPDDSETVASVIVDNHGPSISGQTTALAETTGEASTVTVNQDLPLLQAQAELEQQLASDTSTAPTMLVEPTAQAYRVSLRQQAYLARHNQPMTIMGKVNSLMAELPSVINSEASQLWIRLQNPENTQVIMEAHRPLSLARLPADFKVQIQLPAEVTTRVILGEVSLRTAAIDGETPAIMLASTAFTITAGIAQLLDTIANQDPGTFEEEVSVFPGLPDTAPEPEVDNGPPISVPALDLTRKDVVPAVGVVLPPQLEREPARSLTVEENQPELPSFATAKDNTQPFTDAPSPVTPVNGEVVEAANAVGADKPAADLIATQIKATPFESAPAESTQPKTDNNPELQPENLRANGVSSAQSPTRPTGKQPVELTPPPRAQPNPPRPAISQPPMVAQPAQFIGTSILDDDLEADEIAAVLEDIDKNLQATPSELDTLEPPGVEGALPAAVESYAEAEPAESEKTDQGSEQNRRQSNHRIEANLDFQALKLKDHFWNRLSNLTHESHKEATKLAKEMKDAGVSRDKSLPAPPLFPMDNDEVVIYDNPSPSPNDAPGYAASPAFPNAKPVKPPLPKVGEASSIKKKGLGNRSFSTAQSSFTTSPLSSSSLRPPLAQSGTQALGTPSHGLTHEDLPEMVMPVISVPMGDLVAGEMVTITVRTRPATYKPFIKLWMIDRQSRSLVIEPQLLTNLLPDALGDLQGTVKLQVPMDCLDVQIAAIAIDMATQQESGKAVVNRHIVPANQTSSSPGNFKF